MTKAISTAAKALGSLGGKVKGPSKRRPLLTCDKCGHLLMHHPQGRCRGRGCTCGVQGHPQAQDEPRQESDTGTQG